jgi:hypothetical protein
MKKILILAYDFPPYVSVGGLRPFAWLKYLSRYGVYPIVVTRQWRNKHGNYLDYVEEGYASHTILEEYEHGLILRTPYQPNLANRILLRYGEKRFSWLRRFITAWYEIWQWFCLVGPKVNIYKAANNYLKENRVDVIVATGDPFVLFRYASLLSKKYQIPWIADYRDPWSHDYEKNRQSHWHIFYLWLEKKYVGSATAATTVSEFLKCKIALLFPTLPIYILPNGYDPDSVESARHALPPTDRLRFGFVGTIYEWHPWKSIIRVFYRFHQSHPNVAFEFNFYGINKETEIKNDIEQNAPSLKNHFHFYARMPNRDLLVELGGNHVLLLFNYYSYMGTKIFDYLGLKRLILLCYEQDQEALELKKKYYSIEEVEGFSGQLQADLIRATQSGIVVKDAAHFYEVLKNLSQEFQETGSISCHSKGIEAYSRVHQVQQLAKLLEQINQKPV